MTTFYDNNMSNDVDDQEKASNCYAHSVATAIRRTKKFEGEPIPDRDSSTVEYLTNKVENDRRNMSNTEKALDYAKKRWNIQYKEISPKDAYRYLKKKRFQILCRFILLKLPYGSKFFQETSGQST
jgi:hypothetical protein